MLRQRRRKEAELLCNTLGHPINQSNQSVSLSSPMCSGIRASRNSGRLNDGRIAAERTPGLVTAVEKRSRLFNILMEYRRISTASIRIQRFPPRLLIVLIMALAPAQHWGASRSTSFEDKQFVHQDPTHRHFIAPLTPLRATLSCVLVSKSLASCPARAVGSPGRHNAVHHPSAVHRRSLAIASVSAERFLYSPPATLARCSGVRSRSRAQRGEPASSEKSPDRLCSHHAICVNNELQVGIFDDGVGLPGRDTFALTHSLAHTSDAMLNCGDPCPKSVFVVGRALYRVSRRVMLDSRPVYIPECSARVSASYVDLTQFFSAMSLRLLPEISG